MSSFRGVLHTGLSVACVSLILVGLWFSAEPADDGVVLDRPGAPARLVSDEVSATAFFEMVGNELELTMLFTEPDEAGGVLRSRVRLIDGQRHTIVIGAPEAGGAKRFVFRRVGYTVEMRLDPTAVLASGLSFHG